MATSACVLLSGGLDSAVLAAFCRHQGFSTTAIHVQYGQPAAPQELMAASTVADHLSIPCQVIDVTSPAARHAIGEVRGRNLFLIGIALCQGYRCNLLGLALHAGGLYFDASGAFIEQIKTIVAECSNHECSLYVPFLQWSKAEIAQLAHRLDLPIEITYSCETSVRGKPCGKCRSCQERVQIGC